MGSVDKKGPPPRSPFHIQNIAIIGAGPSGLAAAKSLLAQQAFSRIAVFEQQAEVGGVWNYSAAPSPTAHIPQTSPRCAPDPPLPPHAPGAAPVFPSPMYESLYTNIPHTLMRFSDADFGADSLLFPRREAVKEYVVRYAADVRHLISFSTSVVDVALRGANGGREQWVVRTRNLLTGAETTEIFDAVVVASGHYSVPFVPDVPGIREFRAAHPGVDVVHSKSYRTPEAYRGKKVLVVGNGPSGVDIARQIQAVCQQPLLVSTRTETTAALRAHYGFEEVPSLEEFLVEEKGVRLAGGRVVSGLDAVVFCTGYLFSFPYLDSLEPALVTGGLRVHGLYKHFLHIQHPTLVFPSLPIKVIPFPLAEAQAAVFARIWANALELPPREDMEEWERREAESKGEKFHVFPKGVDGTYINELHAWAKEAGPGGKEPPLWDAELLWQRSVFLDVKVKFEQEGKKAKTLEELGFQYQPKPEAVKEVRKKEDEVDIAG